MCINDGVTLNRLPWLPCFYKKKGTISKRRPLAAFPHHFLGTALDVFSFHLQEMQR